MSPEPLFERYAINMSPSSFIRTALGLVTSIVFPTIVFGSPTGLSTDCRLAPPVSGSYSPPPMSNGARYVYDCFSSPSSLKSLGPDVIGPFVLNTPQPCLTLPSWNSIFTITRLTPIPPEKSTIKPPGLFFPFCSFVKVNRPIRLSLSVP